MQGIQLLVVTGASLHLGRKILFFVKALQAFQYVKLGFRCQQFCFAVMGAMYYGQLFSQPIGISFHHR